ncbi:MAG: patatin-like phospholipase family protein [Deltaproteobacteria bacterium]|nr:patatin-like phospholipase family protein [Deltaproteobacteria bacterium]
MPFSDQRAALVHKLEQLEGAILWDASYHANFLAPADESALRYAFALARVTAVPVENDVVEIGYATERYRNALLDLVKPTYEAASYPDNTLRYVIPEVRRLARRERTALLELFGPRLPALALEDALRHRAFGLALGGGGGVSYVFLGALALLDEARLVPDFIAGTSMGSILGAFRALGRRYDPPMVRRVLDGLSFNELFRVFDNESRFGIPATFKLFLRSGITRHFERDGVPMRLCDLTIPFRAVVGGISAANLGDPMRFAHLLDGGRLGVRFRWRIDRVTRALAEIVSKPLRTIVLGGDELTREFDVVDALGFSAAVPGIIHYDILREDERMIDLCRRLLEREGVARLIDGGVVDNLPARAVRDAVQGGAIRRRDPFVLALDAFAPQLSISRNLLFLPIMRLGAETSKIGYETAHHTVTFRDVPSPLTVVPTPQQIDRAIATGRAQFEKHLPFIRKMLSPIAAGEGIVAG